MTRTSTSPDSLPKFGNWRRMDARGGATYVEDRAAREFAMKQFGIGQPIRRVEDRRFLTGHGRYLDDITRPRQAYAVMLRSPHAHARIRALDVGAAASAPGVLAVFTGADLARAGIGTIPCMSVVTNRDQSTMAAPSHAAIARERVRHVGDAVAMVVADRS